LCLLSTPKFQHYVSSLISWGGILLLLIPILWIVSGLLGGIIKTNVFTALLGRHTTTTTTHPLKCVGITWGIVKTNILVPLGVLGQNTSYLLKCIRITWEIIKTNILIPLGVLGQHTFHTLNCIRITRGIIKTKTSASFLEGFFVIEGQFH